jgi:hypothetical protein
MRAQKMREDATEYFNIIRPVIPMKKEWRVKGKVNTLVPTTSHDDKDGSPPPTNMDINMVFTLSAEFRSVEEEVTQMCLGP